jgi:hypothetical protein
MCDICRLGFYLESGEGSRESHFGIFAVYVNQVAKSRKTVAKWHKIQMEELNIDLEDSNGFPKKGVGELKGNWKYSFIPPQAAEMVVAQMGANPIFSAEDEDVVYKDIEVVLANGKLHYLAPRRKG